jgi:hypothetical protein
LQLKGANKQFKFEFQLHYHFMSNIFLANWRKSLLNGEAASWLSSKAASVAIRSARSFPITPTWEGIQDKDVSCPLTLDHHSASLHRWKRVWTFPEIPRNSFYRSKWEICPAGEFRCVGEFGKLPTVPNLNILLMKNSKSCPSFQSRPIHVYHWASTVLGWHAEAIRRGAWKTILYGWMKEKASYASTMLYSLNILADPSLDSCPNSTLNGCPEVANTEIEYLWFSMENLNLSNATLPIKENLSLENGSSCQFVRKILVKCLKSG